MIAELEEKEIDVSNELLLIDVTQEDIDRGCRGNSKYCPIALALRRMGHKDISVVSWSVRWLPPDTGNWFNPAPAYAAGKLPPEASRFVEDFDNKGRDEVRPFSFLLEKHPRGLQGLLELEWNKK